MSDKIIILTSRPATVKDEVLPKLEEETPLKRRENPKFSVLFDKLWRELDNENKKDKKTK